MHEQAIEKNPATWICVTPSISDMLIPYLTTYAVCVLVTLVLFVYVVSHTLVKHGEGPYSRKTSLPKGQYLFSNLIRRQSESLDDSPLQSL